MNQNQDKHAKPAGQTQEIKELEDDLDQDEDSEPDINIPELLGWLTKSVIYATSQIDDLKIRLKQLENKPKPKVYKANIEKPTLHHRPKQ